MPTIEDPIIPAEMDLLNQAVLKQETLGKYLLQVAGVKTEDLQLAVQQLRSAMQANDTKFFADKGIVTDQRDVVAWKTRLEALDKMLRLFKLLGGADRKLPSGNEVLKVEVDLAPGLKRRR